MIISLIHILSVIDGHTGDMNIANHFQNKFSHLYNSVPTATMKLNSLSECISSKIELLCNSTIKDNDLHAQEISKNDVFKAVGKVKSDKIDVEGRVLTIISMVLTIYSCIYLFVQLHD